MVLTLFVSVKNRSKDFYDDTSLYSLRVLVFDQADPLSKGIDLAFLEPLVVDL